MDDSAGLRLQTLLLGVESVEDFLTELAALARTVLQPPGSCGITLTRDGRPVTVVSTDARASLLDENQYVDGAGPCLHAMSSGQCLLYDAGDDLRWPRFAAVAREQGLRGSFSIPLSVGGRILGAMNLYSFHAREDFDEDAQQRARAFADQAAAALQIATEKITSNLLVAQLEDALQSRSVIDQAMGIVMAQRGCTADEAFDRLRATSQGTQQKLRDVASQLVRQVSGDAPAAPKPFSRTHL